MRTLGRGTGSSAGRPASSKRSRAAPPPARAPEEPGRASAGSPAPARIRPGVTMPARLRGERGVASLLPECGSARHQGGGASTAHLSSTRTDARISRGRGRAHVQLHVGPGNADVDCTGRAGASTRVQLWQRRQRATHLLRTRSSVARKRTFLRWGEGRGGSPACAASVSPHCAPASYLRARSASMAVQHRVDDADGVGGLRAEAAAVAPPLRLSTSVHGAGGAGTPLRSARQAATGAGRGSRGQGEARTVVGELCNVLKQPRHELARL